jgi:hypothetical protein
VRAGPRWLIVSLVGLSVGCSSSERVAVPSTTSAVVETSTDCIVGVRAGSDIALQVDEDGEEAWALPIGPLPPAVGQELKVVFRITGDGPFSVTAVDPSGRPHDPISGPNRHLASNWNHPGDEWGAFFRFDRPGCWEIRVQRGDFGGRFGISVEA